MKPVGIQAFALSCALGKDKASIWRNLSQANRSHMLKDTHFLSGEATYIGKIQQNLPPLPPALKHFDYRANRLLLSVFTQIQTPYERLCQKYSADKIGIILGTSTAGVDSLEHAINYYDQQAQFPPSYQPHHQRMASVAEFLAQYLAVGGPVMSVSTACSSAAKAMIAAQRWLNEGLCDVVITGGVDVLCELTLKGFDALGALSHKPCQPFSANRCGINIGEAAVLFVLSRETADINLLGGGESSDAHHISAPDPQAKGAIAAMQNALNNSTLQANDIDYLNLHGTGTKQNDAMEALAVERVFSHAIPCSSTKALTGHTLGVAGALEIALSALSMSEINSTNDFIPHVFDGQIDEDISPINLLKKGNQLGKPRTILSNSFAFGGSNAALIIGRAC